MNYSCEKPGPRIAEADVVRFEKTIGYALPSDYRLFLLSCNGGVPNEAACVVPFVHPVRKQADENTCLVRWFSLGTDDGLEVAFRHLGKIVPPGLIGIGVETSGDPIILSCRSVDAGAVFLLDADRHLDGSTPDITLARSFESFYAGLRPYSEFDA